MILDFPPNIEQIIIAKAQEQGVSAEQWIVNTVKSALIKPQDESQLVTDFVKGKRLTSFGDPLAFQKAVRDEWD